MLDRETKKKTLSLTNRIEYTFLHSKELMIKFFIYSINLDVTSHEYSSTILYSLGLKILEIQSQCDCNTCPSLFCTLLKVLEKHILTELHLFAQVFSPVLYFVPTPRLKDLKLAKCLTLSNYLRQLRTLSLKLSRLCYP